MTVMGSTDLLYRPSAPSRGFSITTRILPTSSRQRTRSVFHPKAPGSFFVFSSSNGSVPLSTQVAVSQEETTLVAEEFVRDLSVVSEKLSSTDSEDEELRLSEGFDEGGETVIEVEADKEDESLLLKNCGLSQEILSSLEKRGITALFPIQKHVFDPAMQGKDLIGRAKTGSGKTLAFAIPVVENLLKENQEAGRLRRGRAPRALVITPTRELANQVCREFQSICPSLSVRAFYGGVSVGGNRKELDNGVDVAVGTPGRLMDLVDQRVLDLSRVRFAILDESDQMLDMGFERDMEKLLAYTPQEKQSMLFSATLPQWVRKVARKYLSNHIVVDLLGEQGSGRISDTIKAFGMLVQGNNSKKQLLGDLLGVYAAGKKSIVFTQTKREADAIHSVCDSAVSTAVLHGDIAQATREATLERFRRGRVHCMVATDVAARGLDIPSVDLVVHYDCPESHESFVHRSGRTGRAGKKGTTIVLVTRSEMRSFHQTLKETKTEIEMIGPPDPRQVMQASAKHALERMETIQPEVLKFFEPAAVKLLEGGQAEKVLAGSLALLSGFQKLPTQRSLLTQEEGKVTIRMLARPGRITAFGSVARILRDLLGSQLDSSAIGKCEIIEDRSSGRGGALVDLPVDVAMQALQNLSTKELNGVSIDRPTTLSFEQILSHCLPSRDYDRQSRGRSGGYRDRNRSRDFYRPRSGRGDRGGGGYRSDDDGYRRRRDYRRRDSNRSDTRGRGGRSNFNDGMVW